MHKPFFTSVISDTLINFLFKATYVSLLVMLYVMYIYVIYADDTELQVMPCQGGICYVNWIVTPVVDSVLTCNQNFTPCLRHICKTNLSF